jgi:hypothetical protein
VKTSEDEATELIARFCEESEEERFRFHSE